MKLCTKICLWTGGLLLAAGAVLFVCGMTAKNWDFDKLATVRYEQQEYVAQSDVTDVVLNFDVSGIRIVQDKNTQKMTCSYPVAKDLVNGKSAQVTTSEEDGVLTITERNWGFPSFVGIRTRRRSFSPCRKTPLPYLSARAWATLNWTV